MRERRDNNEKGIRKAVEALGYLWIPQGRKVGFDALLVGHGRIVPVEVKDGSKPPSARRLTPNEEKVQAALKAKGVTVELLTDVEQSLDVLRLPVRNFYGREAGER